MIETTKRYKDESEDQYIYRICNMKEDHDWTWNNVAEILNNELDHDYDESCYRKKYQYFTRMMNANKAKFMDIQGQIDALETEKDAVRKERMKLQTVNLERNRLDRAEARSEMWYENVGQYVKRLEAPEEVTWLSPSSSYRDNGKMYVQCISDMHYGAEFVSQQNTFSPEILSDRMFQLFLQTVNFVANHNVEQLTVVNLGDTIQGLIHLSDIKLNSSSIVKAAVEASYLIATYLNSLSAYTLIDYYQVPTANHTQLRVFSQKRDAMPEEDLEFLIISYIHDLLKDNNRVVVHMNDDHAQLLSFDISDFHFVAMHGHRVKNVSTALDDVESLTNRRVDYLLLGHFHNGYSMSVGQCDTHDKEILVAPSIMGSDPYADSLFKGSKAASVIYGFNSNGHVSTDKIVLN